MRNYLHCKSCRKYAVSLGYLAVKLANSFAHRTLSLNFYALTDWKKASIAKKF